MNKITNVKIDLIKNREGLIGFARLLLENDVFLGCIGIHKKLDGSGYRLTYPEKSGRQVFYPINAKMSALIEKSIFDKLNDVMKDVKSDRYNSNGNTRDEL